MCAELDVIALGSTMIRFSVPPSERLETAPLFEVRTAGTESNTLAAVARLGFRTAWVSRLGDNALGRRIEREIRAQGVDTSRVVWTAEDRNELFFVEYGAKPRPTEVIYDRRHAAVTKLRRDELDFDFLLSGKILHLSGIFPALAPACARLTAELVKAAKDQAKTISLDVNYRRKLWSPLQARKVLTPLLAQVDILILTEDDAKQVFGFAGEAKEIVTAVYRRFRPQWAVLTCGSAGGLAWDGRKFQTAPSYPVETVDRLGAGDCFTAGVLSGWLEKKSLAQGMAYAGAMAALKLGIKGDYLISSRPEILSLIQSRGHRDIGR